MKNQKLILSTLFCGISFLISAQHISERKDKHPYYFNISESSRNEIFEVYDHLLSFQYNDNFGLESELPLQIFDWKMELKATLNLSKVYGANYFNIDLTKILPIQYNEVYHLKMKNEVGHVYKANVKIMEAIESEILIDVIVNPQSLACDSPEGNSIEFYGKIQNGISPYSVNWYVMNESRTNLLYQPITENIKTPGKTSAIHLNISPAYYVMLYVVDACGNEQEKMIQLTCSSSENKINTIFVEPLENKIPTKTGVD